MERSYPYAAIGRHEKFADGILLDIQDIESELTLSTAGYTVYFAVDFAELYDYAHPFAGVADAALREEFSTDTERFQFTVRRQVSLAFLLNAPRHNRRLIVLPPHMVELRDHVWLIRRRLIADIPYIGDVLHHVLEEAEKKGPEFDAVITKLERKELLTSDERALYIGYITEYYRELLLLEFYGEESSAGRGLRELHRLWSSGRLATVSTMWPRRALLGKWSPDEAISWEAELNSVESDRPTQNARDAEALSQMQRINSEIGQDRQAVVLVSHPPKMHRIPQSALVRSFEVDNRTVNLRLLRRPECCMTYLVNERGGDAETLEHVRSIRDQLLRYQQILAHYRELKSKSYTGEEITAVLDRTYPTTATVMTQIDGLAESLDSLRLPIARNQYLERHLQIAKRAADVAGHAKRVHRLASQIRDPDSAARTLLEREYASRIAKALAERTKLETVVQLLLSEDLTRVLIEAWSRGSPRGGDLITALLPAERLRYSVKLGDRELGGTVQVILADMADGGEKATDAVVDLLQKRLRASEEPSIHLLFAYLLMIAEAYPQARREIAAGLERPNLTPELRHELLLLKSVVLRISGPDSPVVLCEAVQAAREAVEISHESDPRSLKELGLTLFRYITSLEEQGGDEESRREYSLDDCIRHTEKAEIKMSGYALQDAPDLSGQIANNLLFFYLLLGESDTENATELARKASSKYQDLVKLEPDRQMWEPLRKLNGAWLQLRLHQLGVQGAQPLGDAIKAFDEEIPRLANPNFRAFYERLRSNFER